MNCLRSATGPVSFQAILEVSPIRPDRCVTHQPGRADLLLASRRYGDRRDALRVPAAYRGRNGRAANVRGGRSSLGSQGDRDCRVAGRTEREGDRTPLPTDALTGIEPVGTGMVASEGDRREGIREDEERPE